MGPVGAHVANARRVTPRVAAPLAALNEGRGRDGTLALVPFLDVGPGAAPVSVARDAVDEVLLVRRVARVPVTTPPALLARQVGPGAGAGRGLLVGVVRVGRPTKRVVNATPPVGLLGVEGASPTGEPGLLGGPAPITLIVAIEAGGFAGPREVPTIDVASRVAIGDAVIGADLEVPVAALRTPAFLRPTPRRVGASTVHVSAMDRVAASIRAEDSE